MPPVSPSPVAVEFQHPGASARPVIRPACPGTTWHGGFDSGSLLAAVACALAGAAASGGAGVPGGVVWILVGAVSIGLAPGALRVAFAPGGTGRRCRAAVGVVVLAIAACGGGLAVSPFAAVAAAVVMLSLGGFHAGGDRIPWLGPLLPGVHLAGLVALGSGGAGIGGVAGSAVLSALLFGLAAGVVGGGAVRSRDRRAALLSLWLVIVAIALPLIAAVEATGSPLAVAPFLALLAWRVVPDTLWAASDPWPMSSRAARTAVRRAVIVLAAAIAAGPAGFVAGCAILALLPLAVAAERAMAPSVRAAEITPPIARGPWAC